MNPCGFTDRGVTSMQKELGEIIDIQLVDSVLQNNIIEQFSLVKSAV